MKWSECENDFALSQGSWPEWVAAAIALLALVGAWVALRYSARTAKHSADANALTAAAYERDVKDRREAQARLVYSTVKQVRLTKGISFSPSREARHCVPLTDGLITHVPGMMGETLGDVTRVRVEIHNNSNEIIAPVEVRICDPREGGTYDRHVLTDYDPILPHSTELIEIFGSALDTPDNVVPRLTFRDSTGEWWSRQYYDPIEKAGEIAERRSSR